MCRCVLDTNRSSGVQEPVVGVKCVNRIDVLSDDSICGDVVDFRLLNDKVRAVQGRKKAKSSYMELFWFS